MVVVPRRHLEAISAARGGQLCLRAGRRARLSLAALAQRMEAADGGPVRAWGPGSGARLLAWGLQQRLDGEGRLAQRLGGLLFLEGGGFSRKGRLGGRSTAGRHVGTAVQHEGTEVGGESHFPLARDGRVLQLQGFWGNAVDVHRPVVPLSFWFGRILQHLGGGDL